MSRKKYTLLALLLLGVVGLFTSLTAQEVGSAKMDISESQIFKKNETFCYTLDFRWGFIRGKVGEATLTNRMVNGGQYFSQLYFRTRGIGDTFFKIRDTLETLYSAEKLPLRFEKRINEGGYLHRDLVTFTHLPNNKVKVYVKAYTPHEVKRDSTYVLEHTKTEIVDMLSTLALMRSFDHKRAGVGYAKQFVIPIGKDVVQAEYRIVGYDKGKLPNGEAVETIKINFTIKDKNFENSSQAVEAWVTNDERLLPLKVIARLSVGRVECTLTSFRAI